MRTSSSRKKKLHADPDIAALLSQTSFTDAGCAVIHLARDLNSKYRLFESNNASALDRLKILASLRGFDVAPMNLESNSLEQREALVLLNGLASSKKGQILYNPDRPSGRIAFSIAHEIVHTFFPNTSLGIRFRNNLSENDEASELETLCNIGASELLMPHEEFVETVGNCWSLNNVEQLILRFGSSFEATVFRLATAFSGKAIAGTAVYRRRKTDERKLAAFSTDQSARLFPNDPILYEEMIAPPKYRRQSFFASEKCNTTDFIPWNKSFSETSIVYRALSTDEAVVQVKDILPNRSSEIGTFEAVIAPYQPNGASEDFPNVLFFWKR